MKRLLLISMLLPSPAFAQISALEKPLDDLTAAYYACVPHQERDPSAPASPTGKNYHYSGMWADTCPKIDAAWTARANSEKAARDSADMEKINKAVKQLPK